MADGGTRTAWITGGATIVAALIAGAFLIANTHTSPSPVTPPNVQATTDPSVTAAQLIQRCESAHSMQQENQRDVSPDQATVTLSHCAWPPPPSADPDGYTRIVSTAANGPGPDNASGADEVDRITGPCSTLSLAYSFGAQGNYEHLSPISVRPNSIVRVQSPGTQFTQPLPFYPDRGEADVVRDTNYSLDDASCI